MGIFKGWPTLTEIFFGKEKAKEMAKPLVLTNEVKKKTGKVLDEKGNILN